jgi:hypothetical protein
VVARKNGVLELMELEVSFADDENNAGRLVARLRSCRGFFRAGLALTKHPATWDVLGSS